MRSESAYTHGALLAISELEEFVEFPDDIDPEPAK